MLNIVLGYAQMHKGEKGEEFEHMRHVLGREFEEKAQQLEKEGYIRIVQDDIVLTPKGEDRLIQVINDEDIKDARTRRKSVFAKNEAAFELKLTFLFEEAEVWRIIKVPKCISFEELHAIIQATFQWMNYHCYDFTFDTLSGETHMLTLPDEYRASYINPAEKFFAGYHGKDGRTEDTRDYILGDVLPNVEFLTYTYDYGDLWELEIEVLSETTLEDGHVVCTDGVGDAPCEDVGSEDGYLEFLETIADENHPDHDHMVRWGKDQGYEPFDLDSINERLTMWTKYDTIVGEDEDEDEDFYDKDDEIVLSAEEEGIRDWLLLFQDSLLAKNVSQRSYETHMDNMMAFLFDYVYALRGESVESSTMLATDYLGEYLLDPANDLSTPEEYKGIISSIKMFFQAMLRNKVIDKASHKELLKQIRENQPTWMKTLKQNQGA